MDIHTYIHTFMGIFADTPCRRGAAAYLGHVGIATNILNWMKVLGDYIRKASRGTTTTTTTTTSGYRHARHNGSGGDNDNNFHAVGVYRLLRMQNVISVIGKLSLMLGPR